MCDHSTHTLQLLYECYVRIVIRTNIIWMLYVIIGCYLGTGCVCICIYICVLCVCFVDTGCVYVCVSVYDLWVQDVLMYVYMYVSMCMCVCFVGTGCIYIYVCTILESGEPTIL